jgi:hypothetical protein
LNVQKDNWKILVHIFFQKSTASCLDFKITNIESCQTVAILTGFNLPPIETDGPLGAVCIYKLLKELEKEG